MKKEIKRERKFKCENCESNCIITGNLSRMIPHQCVFNWDNDCSVIWNEISYILNPRGTDIESITQEIYSFEDEYGMLPEKLVFTRNQENILMSEYLKWFSVRPDNSNKPDSFNGIPYVVNNN